MAKKPETEKSETMSIPEAGWKYLRLSRNGSYEAADRGDIPNFYVGRLRRVPIRLMEQMMDGAWKDRKRA
jgi:hypothetical protein